MIDDAQPVFMAYRPELHRHDLPRGRLGVGVLRVALVVDVREGRCSGRDRRSVGAGRELRLLLRASGVRDPALELLEALPDRAAAAPAGASGQRTGER